MLKKKKLLQQLFDFQLESKNSLKNVNYNYTNKKIILNEKEFFVLNNSKNFYNFSKALSVLDSVLKKKGTILFVSSDKRSSIFIKNLALINNQPYVVSKWLSGFLSNFEQVFPSIYSTVKKIKKKNVFSVRKRKTFLRFLKGIIHIKKIPDLIIVFDTEKNQKVIKEASIRNIPVIGFSKIDSNFQNVTYPVVMNLSKKKILLYLKIMSLVLKKYKNKINEKRKAI